MKKNKVIVIEIHKTKWLIWNISRFKRIGFYNTDCGFLINLIFISFLFKKELR